jgi:hypothetical protein
VEGQHSFSVAALVKKGPSDTLYPCIR